VLFVSTHASKTYRLSRLTDILGTSFKLGAQIGVNYGPEYDALIAQPAFAANVTPFTSRRGAWKMLTQGHIDGIIADEVTALVELQQLGLTAAVVRTPVTVSIAPGRVAFSKASVSPDFVAAFDRALDTAVTSGKYREIWERYVPCQVSIEKLGCK